MFNISYKATALKHWNGGSRILGVFQDYVAKRSRKVVVKRIASLDCPEKIEWLKRKTLELANIPNYSMRSYDPSKFLPLMGMEIIDRKKVFIFGPHGNTPRWIYDSVDLVPAHLTCILMEEMKSVWAIMLTLFLKQKDCQTNQV